MPSRPPVPVRLLENFSDLYAHSFWKVCHPVRLLQTVRLLETLEYRASKKHCTVMPNSNDQWFRNMGVVSVKSFKKYRLCNRNLLFCRAGTKKQNGHLVGVKMRNAGSPWKICERATETFGWLRSFRPMWPKAITSKVWESFWVNQSVLILWIADLLIAIERWSQISTFFF